MIIRTLLSKKNPAKSISAGETVASAVETFGGSRIRALPVTEGDNLVGMVTIRDLLKFIADKGAAALEKRVSDAMTRNPKVVAPTDQVEEAAKILTSEFNHLPVVEEKKLVGILTVADLLEARLADVQLFAEDLERYIRGY